MTNWNGDDLNLRRTYGLPKHRILVPDRHGYEIKGTFVFDTTFDIVSDRGKNDICRLNMI